MGFISPSTPDVDEAAFSALSHREKIRLLAQHWVENGFGTPRAILVIYLLKIGLYVVGGLWVVSATTGVGPLSEVASWWREPIVLQKGIVFSLLFEVLGLGCGWGPLTGHFVPPQGAALSWLRPGGTRLPPWPRHVPLTAGHTRSVLDVLLYLGVLGGAVLALVQRGTVVDVVPAALREVPALAASQLPLLTLPAVATLPLLVFLLLAALRDKTVFLAARGEHYALMVVLLWLPLADQLSALRLVLVAIWWGAATSKLNAHFPYVVAVMMSNAPARPNAFRRAMYRDAPDDLQPSWLAKALAHGGTTIEYGVPLLMLLGGGGTLTRVGVVVMVVFHLHIMSTIPMGVPMEWNVFFIYGTVLLFGVYTDLPVLPSDPLVAVAVIVVLAAGPVVGHLRPDLVSFLPAMRYYAGNWPANLWLFAGDAEQKLHEHLTKVSPGFNAELELLYEPHTAEVMRQKIAAWRAMHPHGRALVGLIPRAVDDGDQRRIFDGEMIAGLVLGWNFGDGHLSNHTLLAAVQAQCGFAPGELRVIQLESQPLLRPRMDYTILDAADGVLETGHVAVAEMVARQPWLDGDAIPVVTG